MCPPQLTPHLRGINKTLKKKKKEEISKFFRSDYKKTKGKILLDGTVLFAWKTFYVGITEDDKEEVISSNPLIFHVTSFAQSFMPQMGRTYFMTIVSSYNTFGQLPHFSRMFLKIEMYLLSLSKA